MTRNAEAGTSKTTISDPKGNVEVQQYAYGELRSLTKGAGTAKVAQWTYDYDQAIAGVSKVTDPNGHQSTSAYDASGNVKVATDALNHTTTAVYNGLNQPTSVTNANNVTATNTYDAKGNPLTQSRPLVTGGTTENEVTTFTYGDPSKPGDVTKVTDPRGKATSFAYNAVRRRHIFC